MGYGSDILNSIRLELDSEYQARVPEASQTTFGALSQAFSTYKTEFNKFHNVLFGKIGLQIVQSKMFKNPLAKFKTGGIVSPQDIEEIFVEMATAEKAFDPQGPNPLGRRSGPEVYAIYHRENRQDQYVITVGDYDVKKIFISENTFENFVKSKINSIYSGDNYDEWLYMKKLLATYKNEAGTECGYFPYGVKAMAEDKKKFAVEFVEALRKAVLDLGFMSTAYNVKGVKQQTNPADLALFIHKDVLVHVDVNLLANAFNQSNTDMKVVPEIIPMDNFGDLADTYAIMVDKEWFKVFDTEISVEPQRNAEGRFTNYFYNHHQILSCSTFKNAVRFVKE